MSMCVQIVVFTSILKKYVRSGRRSKESLICGEFVKLTVIDAHTKCSILLLDEEDGHTPRGMAIFAISKGIKLDGK